MEGRAKSPPKRQNARPHLFLPNFGFDGSVQLGVRLLRLPALSSCRRLYSCYNIFCSRPILRPLKQPVVLLTNAIFFPVGVNLQRASGRLGLLLTNSTFSPVDVNLRRVSRLSFYLLGHPGLPRVNLSVRGLPSLLFLNLISIPFSLIVPCLHFRQEVSVFADISM